MKQQILWVAEPPPTALPELPAPWLVQLADHQTACNQPELPALLIVDQLRQ